MESDSPTENEPTSRSAQACERCRIKRVRCSGGKPCRRCQHQGSECTFGSLRGASKQSILLAIDELSPRFTWPRSASLSSNPTSSASSTGTSRSMSTSKSTGSTSRSSGNRSAKPVSTVDDEENQESDESYDDATVSSLASPIDGPSQLSQSQSKRTTKPRFKGRKTRISSACLECKKRRRKVGTDRLLEINLPSLTNICCSVREKTHVKHVQRSRLNVSMTQRWIVAARHTFKGELLTALPMPFVLKSLRMN